MELDLKMAGVRGGVQVGGENGGCPLDTLLNALIIALEIPTLGSSDYLELALPRLCKAAALLPIPAQVGSYSPYICTFHKSKVFPLAPGIEQSL